MTTADRNRIDRRGLPPFPKDFGERLELLREMSGMSRTEFADMIGVTERGLAKWLKGGPPSGAYFWAILELAQDVPGGLELVLYGPDWVERQETGGWVNV